MSLLGAIDCQTGFNRAKFVPILKTVISISETAKHPNNYKYLAPE